MELIPFTTTDMEYRPGEQVDLEANCNDVMFINGGTASLKVGKVPIAPGGTFSINGNLGEINKTRTYKITFSSSAATEVLIVVRKNYLNPVKK